MNRSLVSARRSGFTLVEALIVVALIGITTTLVLPALQQFIHRSKIEGFVRVNAMLLQEAKFEAVKRSVPCVVRLDTTAGEVIGYADVNGDGIFNPDTTATDPRSTDYELKRTQLPVGVDFSAPAAENVVDGFTNIAGFTPNAAVFQTDGSISDLGAFRFGDARNNFLEIRVDPAATARVEVRKWDGSNWLAPGEGGKPWAWN